MSEQSLPALEIVRAPGEPCSAAATAASSHVESYLAEYYGELSEENLVIAQFLAGAARPGLERPSRALDVGCGPTLLYWALFFDGYDEYHGMDASEDNVAFLRGEVAGGVGGRMHERYRPICERLHGGQTQGHKRFGSLCRRVRSVNHGDAAAHWPHADESMDLVTMVFSLEVLPSSDAVRAALAQARRVLAPKGRLVLATLGETTSWRVGDYVGRCLYFTKDSLSAGLYAAGFDPVTVRRQAASTAVEREQGYEWMLFATATRV